MQARWLGSMGGLSADSATQCGLGRLGGAGRLGAGLVDADRLSTGSVDADRLGTCLAAQAWQHRLSSAGSATQVASEQAWQMQSDLVWPQQQGLGTDMAWA